MANSSCCSSCCSGAASQFLDINVFAEKRLPKRGRRLRLHFIAAEFDMLIDFEVICNCFSRLFLVAANGKYFSFLCLAAVCALALIRFRYVFRLSFVSCLFCTRILEHFRSALFVFCSFAICELSGGQKVDARSHFDASCQRACLLCFTLCPNQDRPLRRPLPSPQRIIALVRSGKWNWVHVFEPQQIANWFVKQTKVHLTVWNFPCFGSV